MSYNGIENLYQQFLGDTSSCSKFQRLANIVDSQEKTVLSEQILGTAMYAHRNSGCDLEINHPYIPKKPTPVITIDMPQRPNKGDLATTFRRLS